MDVYVVSDFHLFDREEPFLFNSRKEDCFVELVEQVLGTDSRLLCAGDIFDFTGLNPCARGNVEFFTEAVPETHRDSAYVSRVSRKRTAEELLTAISNAFPRFFASLAKLAKYKRLDFIPGNHDCDLLGEPARQQLARLLGVERDAIRWANEFNYNNKVIVRHGNEFDGPNRTDHGCDNPGKVFTSALYQAVIPALRMFGVNERILSAIPAVRPEEATLLWIEDHLGEQATKKLLAALVRLLERNGFFRGLSRIPGWFLVHDVPAVSTAFRRGITLNRVRSLLPKDLQLKQRAREGSHKVRALDGIKNSETIVVMGHTHVIDVTSNYVNLGTWIDHISGLSEADLNSAECSLPVFHFGGGGARVVDARGLIAGKSFQECDDIRQKPAP